MNWGVIIKTAGEIAQVIGDMLDDGKVNGSNNNNSNPHFRNSFILS